MLELDNDKLNIVTVDLRRPLPFKEDSFDVVYAHLSLHYFDMRTTKKIFDEIYRVLKKDGVLAFFTNALTDPEYGTGHRIEADYFEINGVKKRYLTVDTAMQFAHAFKPLLVDDNGETYKDSDKGVHHLIRFVGRKP